MSKKRSLRIGDDEYNGLYNLKVSLNVKWEKLFEILLEAYGNRKLK